MGSAVDFEVVFTEAGEGLTFLVNVAAAVFVCDIVVYIAPLV